MDSFGQFWAVSGSFGQFWAGLARNLRHSARKPTLKVGKVSGIEVSGRVSGMPEMPGTKLGFGRPKLPEMPKTINLEI